MGSDTINPMSDKEIEIQARIEDSSNLLKFLDSNADFQAENHQVDTYYTPAHRDFVGVRPVDEWLRLRNSNGIFLATYKKFQRNESGQSIYCDEYESEVADLDQFQKIFGALDIRPIIIVNKVRKTWRYQDYEIALDRIKDLGDFVEIEYKGSDSSLTPEQITDAMIDFLKEIGVGEIKRNRVGYPFQLLFPDEVELEVH